MAEPGKVRRPAPPIPHRKWIIGASLGQIFIGSVGLVLGIMGLVQNIAYCINGIWTGPLFGISGAFGLLADKAGGNRDDMLLAFSVLSVITSLAALGVLAWGVILKSTVVFNLILIILVALQVLVAMLSAVFACTALCRDTSQPQRNTPSRTKLLLEEGYKHNASNASQSA